MRALANLTLTFIRLLPCRLDGIAQFGLHSRSRVLRSTQITSSL